MLKGPPNPTAFAVLMTAGWAINVVITEWLIARRWRLSPLRRERPSHRGAASSAWQKSKG